VGFHSQFDAAGNRVALSGDVYADFFDNEYTYDALNRLTQVVQLDEEADPYYSTEVYGKEANFEYNLANQLTSISRYNIREQYAEANTDYTYDALGRIKTIAHSWGGLTLLAAGYEYSWDNGNDLTAVDFLPDGTNSEFGYDYSSEDVSYEYDDRGQLIGANYGAQTDESYAYDDNGNRDTVTNSAGANQDYDPGAYNRLLEDATFTYTYDNEGNLITRTRKSSASADDKTVEYTWDHRNRLVKVVNRNNSNQEKLRVEYRYDDLGQMIRRQVFVNGSGTPSEQQGFVYENGQVVLEFDKYGSGDIHQEDLTHRYLWGPGIDQLLADEVVGDIWGGGSNDVHWALADHLGTVRDWINDSEVFDHAQYDSFGRRLDIPAVDAAFAYTCRWTDPATGLQNNLNRWYNSNTGRFLSEDPIQADVNSYRYVGNQPLTNVDPDGLLTFHYWLPEGGYGHVSITLDNGTYISRWPQQNGRNHGSCAWGKPINVYSVPAIPGRNYIDDMEDEGNRPSKDVRIGGLDEDAIQKWWDQYRGDPSNEWSTVSQNCSTTAMNALKKGLPKDRWEHFYIDHPQLWDPGSAYWWAKRIQETNEKLK
jgi:RHS repeat-associated protein